MMPEIKGDGNFNMNSEIHGESNVLSTADVSFSTIIM